MRKSHFFMRNFFLSVVKLLYIYLKLFTIKRAVSLQTKLPKNECQRILAPWYGNPTQKGYRYF